MCLRVPPYANIHIYNIHDPYRFCSNMRQKVRIWHWKYATIWLGSIKAISWCFLNIWYIKARPQTEHMHTHRQKITTYAHKYARARTLTQHKIYTQVFPYQSIQRCYRINYTLSIGNGIVHTQHQSNYKYSMINKHTPYSITQIHTVNAIQNIRGKRINDITQLMKTRYSFVKAPVKCRCLKRCSLHVYLCTYSVQIVAAIGDEFVMLLCVCIFCHRCDFKITSPCCCTDVKILFTILIDRYIYTYTYRFILHVVVLAMVSQIFNHSYNIDDNITFIRDTLHPFISCINCVRVLQERCRKVEIEKKKRSEKEIDRAEKTESKQKSVA